jgi:hypothetical protein
MGLPRVLPMDVYSVAKRLDFLNDAFGGTWVWAAAEAYCRLVAGVQWVNLPAGAEYIGKWLNCRSAVAVGMRWTEQDVRGGGWGNVLEPGGMSRGAHAMCFYGFEPGYAWRRVPVFGKRRVADVFLAENTNAVAPLTHVPVARMAADALEVVGLVRLDGKQ